MAMLRRSISYDDKFGDVNVAASGFASLSLASPMTGSGSMHTPMQRGATHATASQVDFVYSNVPPKFC